MKPIKIINICAVQYGISYFEVKIENEGYVYFVNIPLHYTKTKGITKTLRGFKKLRAWLETKEGQEYLHNCKC
jgi:hypothetical protein